MRQVIYGPARRPTVDTQETPTVDTATGAADGTQTSTDSTAQTGQASASSTGQATGQQGGQQQSSGQQEPELVEHLPGWSQRLIADLRRQAAGRRVADRDGNNDTSGNSQKQGGPGDVQKPEQPAVDTSAMEEAEARAQAAEIKAAVVLAAAKAGANPVALTDSISFLDSVKSLDPTDDKAVTEAVKKAMEKNPALRAGPSRSGGEFTGGPGGDAVTSEQFKRMSVAQRNELFQRDPTLYRKLAGR